MKTLEEKELEKCIEYYNKPYEKERTQPIITIYKGKKNKKTVKDQEFEHSVDVNL